MTFASNVSAQGQSHKSGGVGALLAMLLVAGCVTTEPQSSGPAAPIPPDVLQLGFDIATAEKIAEGCPQSFKFNYPARLKATSVLEKKYGSNPVWLNNRSMDAIPQDMAQDMVIKYITKRKVVLTRPSTWCPAGRAEVAEKTSIGRMLIVR
jgi:hypothetical protein